MKGTYRTALEWAKLLLSLDPEDDPYCMRFMVHHLALRAGEFNWLLDLFETKLPSMWSESASAISHITPSLALAAMSLKEGAQCRKLLSESMQTVPWLFVRLFKELNLDAPSSIWGIEPRSDAEVLFTEIYVLQTKDLWNTPAATALLMEIAHTISKVDHQMESLDNSEMTLAVVRYVYLDNTPTLMAMAPSNLLHRPNNSDSDPLPPETNIFSYESQKAAIEGRQRGAGMEGAYNPLEALARLLPGLGPNGEGGEQGEQVRRELEEAMAGQGSEGREAGIPVPLSLVRRVLGMIWPGGERRGEDYLSDLDDVDYEESENTDTDEEMPELVEQEESEDEMPGLVPQ